MKRRRLLGSVSPLVIAGCLRLDETASDEKTPDRTSQQMGSDGDSTGGNESAEDDGHDDSSGDDEGGDPDDESVAYPRGLNEDSVSPLLADSHVKSLQDSSFEFEYTLMNYTEGWERPSARARVENGIARREEGTEHFYRDDLTEWLWTMQYRGDRLYGIMDSGPRGGMVGLGDIVYVDHLRALLRSVSFHRIETVEWDGERLFRIEGDTVEDPAPAVERLAIADLSGASVEGYVGKEGTVRSLEAELEYTREGEANLADFVYDVRNIDETTVEEPDWVPTAEERAPSLSLEQSDDGTYFRLEHEGGQALRPNTKIEQTGDRYSVHLDRKLEVGDVLYLWFEDDQLNLSRDGPPSDATVLQNAIIEITLDQGAYFSWRVRHL